MRQLHTMGNTHTDTATQQRAHIMTILKGTDNIHSSVTTFAKGTHNCTVQPLGGFTDATHRLHSVDVHEVQRVTQRTTTIGKGPEAFKVTTITLHTASGDIQIKAFKV